MTTSVRVEGLANVLNILRALPAEATKQGGNIVRTAVRKAGQVILGQAEQNLDAIIAAPNASGIEESTGLLRKNLVLSRGRMQEKGERYLVRVRPKRYADSKGKRVTTTQVARLLETGTESRDAMPWLRPAFESKKGEAVEVMTREVTARLDALVKRLDRRR